VHYAEKGWNAAVTVDDEFIRIVAVPETGVEPKEYVLGLLQHGFLEDALPLLEVLDGMLDDPDIAYNHGVCLSEMGRTADAIPPLRRCVQLDPYYTHAHIALGVALAREGRADEAARALRIAIEQEPDDVFAVRNLAGVLANAKKLDEALPLFRRAVDLQPADPVLRFGLARCLQDLGGDHAREADAQFRQIIRDHPEHSVAEAARSALTKTAQKELRAATKDLPRMDALAYMQGALDTFEKLPRSKVGEIVMEIARLGQSGLAINDPGRRYSLKTLPGDFSGLHLLCLMHVGFRMFDPSTDPGTGLDQEYEMARSLRDGNA
jgi:tetratricopeptide (TPR) repeat protein